MLNDHLDNLLISISRLVAVDSVGVAIAEIDLREGGILIGSGNIGKTSILNAIRLFLLPEENFKNSKKKFGFSDKEGKFYSDDESFNHYFPSSCSFLILECDNQLGGPLPHCQILYRGNSDKLDYRRMFTSLRYQQIRHLFWDQSYGDENIGGAVQGLTPAKVQAYLKQHDKHFKTLMRASAIKELIYANQLLDVDAMRYCLFPLTTTSDAEIDAFRALVRLLFDMKTGSDTVRLAVANIIESQKKERKDALHFDIDGFIEHNDALARREKLLTNIDSLRPQFEQLSRHYQALSSNQNAEQRLMQFALMAEAQFNQQNSQLKQQQAELTFLKSKMTSLKQERNAILDEQKTLTGEQKVITREQKKLATAVQEAQLILHRYDEDESLEIIVEGLKSHLSDKQQELEVKQDSEQRHERLNELNQKIEEYKIQQQTYLDSIAKQEFKLFNQLDQATWRKLAAVNLEVAEANPGRALTDAERSALVQFGQLFTEDAQGYRLFNLTLKAIDIEQRASDQSLLDKVNQQLALATKEAESLGAVETQSRLDLVKDINELKREIKLTEDEIKQLQGYQINAESLEQRNQELNEIANRQQQFENQLQAQQQVLDEQSEKVEAQSEVCASLEKQVSTLTQCKQNTLAQLNAYGLSMDKVAVMPDKTLLIEQSTLMELIEKLDLKRSARAAIVDGIQGFVRQQVLENDDQLMQSAVDDERLEHAFKQLESRYQRLDEEFDILRKNFLEHNHTIHSIINELKNNREMVRHFEQSINRAFAGVKINDLEQVEASIQVEARFGDLVAEIEHLDTHSDQQASAQFIERLRSFSQRFFPDGKARLLTMEQIVAGISYRVKKQRQTRWETKSQSTSTIMLINLKLVEILLGRLRNKACTTHFPLIIDEGASVDSSQFDWLLPNMKQAGFRVLSASTNSASSEIIFKFGQHFRLDSMHTANPYHFSRTIAYTGMPDCFVAQDSRLDRESLDMFGALDE